MNPYDHIKVESYWKEKWDKEKVYATDTHSSKPTFYGLVEFPYPSGAGLHVGHVRSYTGMDVIVRKRRMEGFETLFPIGWDAFGLPAENYAIKTGIHPSITTRENIATFREQLKACGFSFDWDREVDTTDPAYYKWTQWIFLKLYEKGLAYKKQMPVNWCPKDKCVLANEEVVDGKCERCGTPAEKRDKEQWMLAITKYAERLDRDLDDTEFLERIKIQQRNWIGLSEGSEIDFPLSLSSNITEVVFASNNKGKAARIEKLLKHAGIDVKVLMPSDVGISDFDVVEDGKTLEENATKKAQTLAKLTDKVVIADDTGFFIHGEELDPVTVKRNALVGKDEKDLSIDEVGAILHEYYKTFARDKGGKLDAEWKNAICTITPDGTETIEVALRPVILTDESHGTLDPYLPLRPLYMSKATGKYVLEQNEEEEMLELSPIAQALKKLLRPYFTVYTTRADTIFGCTYCVLAPEHTLVKQLLASGKIQNKNEVQKYIDEAVQKIDIDRSAEGKEKTGVKLEGVMAINPANQKEIPVYIADYVLATYGTGAIMAVPAHDERDGAFAKKYGVEIFDVIAKKYVATGADKEREDVETIYRKIVDPIIHDTEGNFYLVKEKEGNHTHFAGGGVDDGEVDKEALAREITEELGFTDFTIGKKIAPSIIYEGYRHTKNKNQRSIGPAYEVIIDSDKRVLCEADEGKHEIIKAKKEDVLKLITWEHHRFLFEQYLKGVEFYTEDGVLFNSNEFDGLTSVEARIKITEAVGGRIVKKSKLRDWVFARQRYWGEPIPLVYDKDGKMYPVHESELPITLPQVDKYEPTDNGESPLYQVPEWVNIKGRIDEAGYFHTDTNGEVFRRETDTMPQWAGSSWYFMRYIDPKNDRELGEKEMLMKWLPVTWYNGGMEHTTLHLLYSRFWYKFLFDIGMTPTSEPYYKRTSQGMILGTGGVKMSKSLGNVINPDIIVKKFGADTLRMYEMFIGPFDQAVAWDDKSVIGVRRFIDRTYALKAKVVDSSNSLSVVHKTIKKVTADIESMAFNTAISSLMICLNEFEKEGEISKADFKLFLQLLAPFAPFIAEELWKDTGGEGSVHLSVWPKYDESKLVEDEVLYVLQVNGKLRGEVKLPLGTPKNEVLQAVRKLDGYEKYVGKALPKKEIFIEGKLVNIVI